MTARRPADEHLAVVTGASDGLGRALSVAFCRRGVRVVGVARRVERLMETEQLCGSSCFSYFAADVAATARIGEVFAEVEERIGPVTILINNAAVYARADFLSATAEHTLGQIAINLNGSVNCASAALRHMAARGRGRIVNVSSFAGEGPVPGSLGYSVSKAALRALTRALTAETRDRLPGIVISEWIPGVLNTSMGRAGGIDPEVAAEWGVSLALADDPDLHGATFVEDRELIPRRSLKGRVKDFVLRIPPRRPRRL